MDARDGSHVESKDAMITMPVTAHNPRRTAAIVLSGAAGAMLAVALVTLLLLRHPLFAASVAQRTAQAPLETTAFSTTSPIAVENRRPGTTAWMLDGRAARGTLIGGVPATRYIQGYAGVVSALPGARVSLYISSVAPVGYRVDVYRIGWYQGLGGRLMYARTGLISAAQGYWTPKTGLVGCHACTIDPKTIEIDAHWRPSFTLPIGAGWLSGMYLVKLTATNGAESYIPLVVRDDASRAAALASFAVNTYQAYNEWGGASLYTILPATRHPPGMTLGTKVSFNRPYEQSAGSGFFLGWDIHTVRWMERTGLDVTYTTNVDVSEHADLLDRHALFLSIGHDEYWTKAMRDGIEAARDSGVSLGFFGANASYWQARYEPDASGAPDRMLVCYKVSSHWTPGDPQANPANDPMYPAHPDLVTTYWRDPILHRPENELLGIEYIGFFPFGRYMPDWVATNTPDPLEIGTGLKPGEHIAGGLLGYEVDGAIDSQTAPPGVVLLSRSPVVIADGSHSITLMASTSYYRAASGAIVFDAGSIWWGWGLDDLSPPGANQPNLLRGNEAISKLTTNIIHAMLVASLDHQTGVVNATPTAPPVPTVPASGATPTEYVPPPDNG